MRILALIVALACWAPVLPAQSVLERSPNLYGVWTLPSSNWAFVLAHRFEFRDGGDELLSIPTLTLALGLPLGLTAGLDYTSNSDVVSERGGNENQLWLKRAFTFGPSTTLAALAAYNTAAESADGALSLRQDLRRLKLFAEGRAFSDLFGAGDAGAAGIVGASLGLTEFLAITADVGRVLTQDSFPAVWGAAVAVQIPGTPHTLSLQATNSGSITLHGASRERPRIYSTTRYGFAFTVPLGTGSRWARIFRPSPAGPSGATPQAAAAEGAARVELRGFAFTPGEVRIRPGQSVEWINRDPAVHTVTSDDGSWSSDSLQEGQRFVRRFDQPGRYTYHCTPHPQMTGVVVVEGG